MSKEPNVCFSISVSRHFNKHEYTTLLNIRVSNSESISPISPIALRNWYSTERNGTVLCNCFWQVCSQNPRIINFCWSFWRICFGGARNYFNISVNCIFSWLSRTDVLKYSLRTITGKNETFIAFCSIPLRKIQIPQSSWYFAVWTMLQKSHFFLRLWKQAASSILSYFCIIFKLRAWFFERTCRKIIH